MIRILREFGSGFSGLIEENKLQVFLAFKNWNFGVSNRENGMQLQKKRKKKERKKRGERGPICRQSRTRN